MGRSLLVALGTLALLLFASSPADAATRGCNPSDTVRLDVSGAARAPTVGASGARTIARQLIAPVKVCDAQASPAVRALVSRALGAARAGDRTKARSLLAQAAASVGRRADRAPAAHRAVATDACDIDRRVHVRPGDAPDVGDFLSIAQAAFTLGDDALGERMVGGAQNAYKEWASGALARATSVGDFVSIAAGAQMLGLDAVAKVALDRAKRVAEEHYKEIKEQMDSCFPKKRDFDCQLRAVVILQLLGVDEGERARSLPELRNAVLHDKPVSPCEEWAFTMQLTATDNVTGAPWTIRWNEGRFRVDRKKGRFAKIAKPWPGTIGDDASRCIEESDAGRIDHGAANIIGGPFHYAIDGSASSGEIDLSVESKDARVSVTAPPNDACQFLRGLADLFINGFVKGPYDLPFTVAPGQTSATLSDSGEGYSFSATITRIKP